MVCCIADWQSASFAKGQSSAEFHSATRQIANRRSQDDATCRLPGGFSDLTFSRALVH
jgi:hypothetical protein